METLYCVCGEPVMDVEIDAGCRRCGRPVDFSPALRDALAVSAAEQTMLCAVCSKPLGDAALCNLDEKWVHPNCGADAEWVLAVRVRRESESAASPEVSAATPLGLAADGNPPYGDDSPECRYCREEATGAAWSYRLRLAWERRKLAASETWLRLWGIDGEILPHLGPPPEPFACTPDEPAGLADPTDSPAFRAHLAAAELAAGRDPRD